MIKLNGVKLFTETFPNGESVLKVNPIEILDSSTCGYKYESVNIEVVFENDMDLFRLGLLVTSLRNKYGKNMQIDVEMLYFPYSRMDREIGNQVFALKAVVELIAKIDFNTLTVLDLHSDVSLHELTLALGNRFNYFNASENILAAIGRYKPDIILFPDKGAKEKYSKILNCETDYRKYIMTCNGLPVITANKERDRETGRIKSIGINESEFDSAISMIKKSKNQEVKVLFIDDICANGGTFIGVVNSLNTYAQKAGYIIKSYAYFSHCEKGIQNLMATGLFTSIFTPDSLNVIKDLDSHGTGVIIYK